MKDFASVCAQQKLCHNYSFFLNFALHCVSLILSSFMQNEMEQQYGTLRGVENYETINHLIFQEMEVFFRYNFLFLFRTTIKICWRKTYYHRHRHYSYFYYFQYFYITKAKKGFFFLFLWVYI